MATLIITRGLPGSGKTTLAKAWVAEDPAHRARVNRDDARTMIHNGYVAEERTITTATEAMIRALLGRGIDVISDDTNLPARTARGLRRLAELADAKFTVVDLTDVPLEVCIERDADRERTVGADVIRDKYDRYVKGNGYPLPLPDEVEIHGPDGDMVLPYTPIPGTKKAIIVDIDGTVALMSGRSPYDPTRVHEDRPNFPVIRAVRLFAKAGYRIVFCSGRTDDCRDATEAWLRAHYQLPYDGLHMRPAGDGRKDSVVKLELFDQHIRSQFDVHGVFDDRDQVVKMWRSIGLTVFQVADGNF